MATIYDLAAKHRAALLAGDREAANAIVGAYGQAWTGIQVEVVRLAEQVDKARAAGLIPAVAPVGGRLQPEGTFPMDWLRRQERYRALQRQVERQLLSFADSADLLIQDAQREAIASARRHSAEQIGAGLRETAPGIVGDWDKLNTEAFGDLVGNLVDGSPLRELLDALADDAGSAVERGLVEGLSRGLSPRDVAARVRGALGGNLNRALTIARTEQLRAYREATRRAYEANPEVVGGWTWNAAADRRTCAACWAMHGSRHPVTERLDGHPNCRCSMIPVTRSWEDLGASGLAETTVELPRGEDLFARLPEAHQRAILGKAKFDAYHSGELRLSDFVGRSENDRWGSMRRERSLREARLDTDADDGWRLGEGLDAPEPIRPAELEAPAVAEPGRLSPHPDARRASDHLADVTSANGAPVGNTKVKRGVARAQEAIDNLHGVPSWWNPQARLPIHESGGTRTLGRFRHKVDGRPVDIAISRAGSWDHQGFSFLHEFGHFLDHQDFGGTGAFSSVGVTDRRFDAFRQAVRESDAWRELVDMLNRRDPIQVTLTDGRVMNARPDRAYVRYLASDHEVFARAYSQWVATESGDASLIEGLEGYRRRAPNTLSYPNQWTDEDFAPIAAALRDLFRDYELAQ